MQLGAKAHKSWLILGYNVLLIISISTG